LFTLYGALIAFMLLVLFPIALFVKLPIKRFIKEIAEPVSLAFATTSSEAALPKAMTAMERMGVPRKIVAFVMPTGYSFNLDGTTLWGIGDWAVFNGSIWQKVDGGDSGNFVNISVSALTGYMYANGTSNVTASLTIPNGGLANSTITLGNTTLTLGGTTSNVGNLTVANVTILGGTTNASVFNFTSNTTATATYGIASLPLQPAGFMQVNLNGTVVKVPYYAV
jgi:hypothetical protein